MVKFLSKVQKTWSRRLTLLASTPRHARILIPHHAPLVPRRALLRGDGAQEPQPPQQAPLSLHEGRRRRPAGGVGEGSFEPFQALHARTHARRARTHARTHARTRARARTRAHTHAHTRKHVTLFSRPDDERTKMLR